MRRYDLVSGILLILSIIDFALGAPVLVREKHPASVDAVNIPKDVITVLGKRGDEEIEELASYLKTWGKPVDSSDAHASSSSAPPGPDHGPTDAGQAPAPDPASSTANPDPLMDPSSPSMDPSGPSSIRPIPDSFADRYDEAWGRVASDKGSGTSMEPLFTPGSSAYGSDNEWVGEHSPRPNPNPEPTGPVDGADPEFDWNYWTNKESPPIPSSPKEGIGLDPEYQGHGQQFNTRPSTGPDSTDPDPNFDWDYWMNRDDPLAPSPTQKWVPKLRVKTKPDSDPNSKAGYQPLPYSSLSPTEDHDLNQPSPVVSSTESYSFSYPAEAVVHPLSPGAGLSEHDGTPSSPDLLGSPKTPGHEVVPQPSPDAGFGLPTSAQDEENPEEDVIKGPPTTPDSELTDPELNSDHQLLSTGTDAESQLHSIIYAAKGKAKAERSISGTTMDVGNAAQRELRPAERSLDPGDEEYWQFLNNL